MDEPNSYVSAYLEEAGEHQAELTALLPRLAHDPVPMETIHAAFRAMHSIKGGAAIFGLAVLADLAHGSEHLLDALRAGERPANENELDTLSQALEVMDDLIGALRRGERPERGAAQNAIDRLAALGSRHPGLLPHDLTGFDDLAELTPDRAPSPRFAPPASGDADGFGFFVPLEEGAVAAPEAEFLQDELLGPAEFFVIMPGDVEPVTGLPVLTPMSSQATVKSAPVRTTPVTDPRSAVSPPAPVPLPLAPPPPTPAPALEPESAAGDIPSTASHGNAPAPTSAAMDSLRVSSARLDGLLDLAGSFSQLFGQFEEAISHDFVLRQRVEPVLDQFDRMTRELHAAVMALRLVPLLPTFNRLTRVVRELAEQVGKPARLELTGAETEVDKALVERLSDPLLHLVRNSLDHGIEPAAERLRQGKPAIATLRLSAEQRAGQVVIALEDDGTGLSRPRILERARQLGMALPDDVDDDTVWACIFEPGFSTATRVNALSGRGVGLDVVRQTLQGLGGRVQVSSRSGLGVRFELRLPLTLAVLDGMLVAAAGDSYLLPLTVVRESLDARAAGVHTVAGGQEAVVLQGRPVPVFRLHDLFGLPRAALPAVLVVVQDEAGVYALAVDELHGQHSAVVKGLDGHLRGLPGITGSTIVGAGRTALILDPHALPGLLRRTPGTLPNAL